MSSFSEVLYYSVFLFILTLLVVPRVQREEDQVRLVAPTQMALCLRFALLKGESWQRAVVTLDDSTPQRRISELRVWSYEPFIVFVPSSSGYLSGQNLEVLYIIRNSILNIIK